MAGIGSPPPPPSGMSVAGMGVNPILPQAPPVPFGVDPGTITRWVVVTAEDNAQALIANTIVVRTTSRLSVGIPDEAHLDYNAAIRWRLTTMEPLTHLS
jgi:hypothetical protein